MQRVHFANNISESPSPLSELSTSSFDTRPDMLQLSPADTIIFQKSNSNDLTGNVHILNVSQKALTYKVKTTAPDKYRVRPSSGTLSSMTSVNINVVVQKGQQIQPINKDKFLVMCMVLPEGQPLTNDEVSNMWKEVSANSSEVEQHRLKCAIPTGITTATINNPDMSSETFTEAGIINVLSNDISHNGMKQSVSQSQQHLHATINQLNESLNQLNQQIKAQHSLQWMSIFMFIVISIVIVYILKIEIQNSNSQYCIDK
ncbi:CLUMA_CG006279, isoform A [Clunio marinus]|uniref:CLUMA_CG006279, isoform A n=1 Tax=Clunio marinus TaxID=568069 RepID=A0A1J1I334_9DIPT|nr:CLUMA_CG006279, isoform A [Clunio marinus]